MPDIVQETFLRLSQYPEPECIRNPRAFLFQTAANLSVDRRHREIRERYNDPEAEMPNKTALFALLSAIFMSFA